MFKKNATLVTFAVGVIAGIVGVPALKTKTARKVFTYATAGGFIARDSIMETVEKVQANALDIAEDAKVITEKYYADKAAECCGCCEAE